MSNYLLLIYEFFKIGLFAVGGGLATIPFLYDLASKYDWLDPQMLADMIAVAESTPGPIGINMATFAGFKCEGLLGGIVATFSLVFPSLVVIIIVSKILQQFKNNIYVQNAFYGIRPAVTALITVAVWQITKISLFIDDETLSFLQKINVKALILFVVLFLFNRKFKLHPIVIIIISAIIGILFKF